MINKYFQVFKISLQQEFVYRSNFVMWRVRNVFQIFLVFFLWDTVFSDPTRSVFGYNREKILTYVFGLIIIKAFVLSSRAIDVSGDISRGDLVNYLLKPFSYFKYWIARDFSIKGLNLVFAIGETSILFILLRPPFFLQNNLENILGFLALIVIAILIYFTVVFIVSSVPFWMPEAGWGAHFIITVVLIEFMSGALFPLDILPPFLQNILSFTPFPYLIFYPLQVYLGNITGISILKAVAISGGWLILLSLIMKSIWRRGLKVYQSHGR